MMCGEAEEGEVDPAARARRRATKNCMGGRSQGRAGEDWADSKQLQVITVRCAELMEKQYSLLVGEGGEDS